MKKCALLIPFAVVLASCDATQESTHMATHIEKNNSINNQNQCGVSVVLTDPIQYAGGSVSQGQQYSVRFRVDDMTLCPDAYLSGVSFNVARINSNYTGTIASGSLDDFYEGTDNQGRPKYAYEWTIPSGVTPGTYKFFINFTVTDFRNEFNIVYRTKYNVLSSCFFNINVSGSSYDLRTCSGSNYSAEVNLYE